MFNAFKNSRAFAISAIAASALIFASSTFAGNGKVKPGKPGSDGGTIVDIALAVNDGGNGEFNNLLAVVGCFGPLTDNPVVDLLSGDDKLTLFAPNDAAFNALLDRLGVMDPCVELIEDPDNPLSSTLFTVLAYHVVEGRRFSNSVFNANNAKLIDTLAGASITSYTDMDGTPLLTDIDGQTIGIDAPMFNINATNGVIHVVDTVLLPIDLPDPE